MKCFCSLLALLFAFSFSYAQNTFPTASGTNVGIAVPTTATHSLTFGSTSTGIALYNTTDQTTNYERLRQFWNGNAFYITTELGGTGTAFRPIFLGLNSLLGVTVSSATTATNTGVVNVNAGSLGTPSASLFGLTTNLTGTGGVTNMQSIVPAINQSSTAGYRMLWISPYESAIGSGTKYLIDAGTNSAANGAGTHTSKFTVDDAGNVFSNQNVILNGRVGIGTFAPASMLSLGASVFNTSVAFSNAGFGIHQNGIIYTSTGSSGTIAATGINTFNIPTLATSNATTLTTASTFRIAGAPVAGANVTITNPLALEVATGAAYFGGSVGIGTVAAPGNLLTVNGLIKSSNLYTTSNNTYVGLLAANATTTGGDNTIMGYNAAPLISTGNLNTIIGANAAKVLTTGTRNTIIGTLNTSWNATTAQSLTTGSDNTLIGTATGAYMTTANRNVAIGDGALLSATGSENIAIGYTAGGGSGNGANNVFMGIAAGQANTTGSNNVMVGWHAGSTNTTGSSLTFIGNSAGYGITPDGLTNATAIGYNAQVTASNSLILGNNANVGIGTTAPDSKLSVNGTIHSKQVKVDLIGLPDYVFKPAYQLPKLSEVKAYIDQNQHLPEIPSAQDVAKNGLDLGEMNKLLLKKVEELTLYLIEQDKAKNEQDKRIQKLEQQLNDLHK